MDLMSRRRILLAQSAQESGVLATATGNPMTFTTDLVRRLHSLAIPFSPVQATGTPSPDNPLPISGWTGANVYNETAYDASATPKLNISWQSSVGTVYGGTVTLNEDGSADLVADREYKRYTGEYSEVWIYSSWTHENNAVFYSYVQVQGAKYTSRNYNYIKNCNMLPIITYDELSGQDIAGITITGGGAGLPSIGIPKSVLSTVDVVGLTSYLSANPLDIIYELATPITYHFDNVGQLTTFTTFIGTNTIWTDTNGTNTAEYWIKNT